MNIKIGSFKKFSNYRLVLLVAFCLVFAIFGAIKIFMTKASAICSISTSNPITSERLIKIDVSNCSGVENFIVSEDPNYANDGVKVKINSVSADNTSADLSINYPTGTPIIGEIKPYSVPSEQKQMKTLAVLFTFEDSEGNTAGLGDYQTLDWVKKLVFGDGGVGFEGYFTKYSAQDHVYQSTNGRITLTGEVYPKIIKLPLEKYRQFLNNGGVVGSFNNDIIKHINNQDPTFLAERNFDFLISLSSEQYSVNRSLWLTSGSYGSIKRGMSYQIPVDAAKSSLDNIREEKVISNSTTEVVPKYNPSSGEVEGVWLASDTNRSGINYFSGGTTKSQYNSSYYLQLGTPLPEPNTLVAVRYKAMYANHVDKSLPNQVPAGSWFQHFIHEMYHEISKMDSWASFRQRGWLGDLYKPPARVAHYDTVSSSKDGLTPQGKWYQENNILSGHNKMLQGFVNPYTLAYGKNEPSLRIYKSAFGDVNNVANTTLIKVPLRPKGEPGLATMIDLLSQSKQYRGEEYLLIEWYYKGELENQMHNFGRLSDVNGLAIYRVVESSAYDVTGHSYDIVRLVDATPPVGHFNDSYSSSPISPELFGSESGVLNYSSGSYWQKKVASSENHSFEYLLSDGKGAKMLYVKFLDSSNNVISTQQLGFELANNQSFDARKPTMNLDMADGTIISGLSRNVKASYTLPNKAKNLRFYVDGVLKRERTEGVINQTNESFYIKASEYTPGPHILKAVLYDGSMSSIENQVSFTIGSSNGDSTPPTIFISSPSADTTVYGSIKISAEVSDNVGIAKVEFMLNGVLINSDSISPYSFVWDSSIAPAGLHTITAKAYDSAGNTHSDNIQIYIGNSDVVPPSIPTGLTAILSSESRLNLSWTASTDNIAVMGYKIYRDGHLIGTSLNNNYTDTGLVAGKVYSYNVSAYDAAGNNSVQSTAVTIGSTTKLGDINGDGYVNIIDLSILAFNFNSTKSNLLLSDGDLDGNGVVNIFDLSILSANWGD